MFDFQKVWTLLDIILKIAQTGSTELHNITAAANAELRAVHNDLVEARAVTMNRAIDPAPAPVPTGSPLDGDNSAVPPVPTDDVEVPPPGDLFSKPIPESTPSPAPAPAPSTMFKKD